MPGVTSSSYSRDLASSGFRGMNYTWRHQSSWCLRVESGLSLHHAAAARAGRAWPPHRPLCSAVEMFRPALQRFVLCESSAFLGPEPKQLRPFSLTQHLVSKTYWMLSEPHSPEVLTITRQGHFESTGKKKEIKTKDHIKESKVSAGLTNSDLPVTRGAALRRSGQRTQGPGLDCCLVSAQGFVF